MSLLSKLFGEKTILQNPVTASADSKDKNDVLNTENILSADLFIDNQPFNFFKSLNLSRQIAKRYSQGLLFIITGHQNGNSLQIAHPNHIQSKLTSQ